jgi:ribosomal protein S18 acetylase RimI-like enzyme
VYLVINPDKGGCVLEKEIADKNLFMMCKALNPSALTELSNEYHVRTCRRNEINIWKEMPFDDVKSAKEYDGFMKSYFNDVYADRESLFFQKCLFVCDKNDTSIATCFGWKSYEKITTIHWFKVLKKDEGLGIGRALLSIVMNSFAVNDYPVYLHTQPPSFRAIKLYSDFGFAFLTDQVIGYRQNDLQESLPFLKANMFQKDFEKLQFAKAPEDFLKAVKSSNINQF